MKTILLLGGYGRCGERIAHWLLQETDVRLVVAGRRVAKADQLAADLNASVGEQRVTACVADAGNPDSLRAAFTNADFVVACLPTTQYTEQVARAALGCGLDYLDYAYPAGALNTLRTLAAVIEHSGRCFITQAGFHPGLVAPLVRFAAPRFSTYRKADVGMIMNFCNVPYSESAREFMEELGEYDPSILVGGQWRKAGWRDRRPFDFGDFGRRTCVPLDFAEMHSLPVSCGLQEAGCYVAGFNWFVDGLVFPLAILLAKIKKGLGARFLGHCWAFGMNRFARPPYGVVMRLEAEGQEQDRPLSVCVTLRHHDIFDFTAIPIVACLKQYLDGTIARPGLWLMGEVVEPVRLLHDMEHMGVAIETAVAAEAPVAAV